MRVIATVSGGKSSAWTAWWAVNHFPKEDVILYFNDTKWEHEDTYRFLRDLEAFLGKKIVEDSDGRSPEELFYDMNALAGNLMPFCSKVLKAQRLERFAREGDLLIFGFGLDEKKRAERTERRYRRRRVRTLFPLIEENVSKEEVDLFLKEVGIQEPLLYRLGFKHNNCSGGCVRAGKKQWKLLWEKLPQVYLDRERVEREVRAFCGRPVSFLKGMTLEEFRKQGFPIGRRSKKVS